MKTSLTLLAVAALLPAAGAQNALKTYPAPMVNAAWGAVVARAGDVNNDGRDDVAVTDRSSSWVAANGGIVRIYSGHDGEMLHAWNGTANQGFGSSVAALGDVNGDGWDDVAVGASGDDTAGTDAGAVIIRSGMNGAVLKSFFGATAGDGFGAAMASAGDLNFDGIEDLVASAPYADVVIGSLQPDVGYVRVYNSVSGSLMLNLKGAAGNSLFGSDVDGAGDVNKDGTPDIVIGIRDHDFGVANVGRVEVHSGINGALIFGRNSNGGWYGAAVAGIGDVNGDGWDDVAVGAPHNGALSGRVEVLLGPSGTVESAPSGDNPDDMFGVSLDGVGDVDKDGYDDYIVGADGSDFDFGYARIFSGRTGGLLYGTIYGDAPGDEFGRSVACAGDTNADGWVDVVVGADDFTTPGYARLYDVLVKAPNLGSGGPGSATLSMYGSPLTSFGEMDLALKGAAPSKPAFLIASLGTLNAPLKGGVLVPNIGTGLLVILATDAQGKVLITGIPGGNGPLSLYVQCLIKDPAQAKGWAFSNAIKPQLLP